METPKITCFGAAHVDRRAHALGPIARATSNPVNATESPGGVAHNVAEVLAMLGDEVALVSVMGRDRRGQIVASSLTEAGVDLTSMMRSEDFPTATYTALVEPDGHLYVGLADMAIYELLTPDELAEPAEEHAGDDAWFLDANLPPESVTFLAARSPGFLAANPVSVPKARRLVSILDRLDLLVANTEEASEIAGSQGDAMEVGLELHDQGVKVVAITLHERGAIVVANGSATPLDALTADARDVTGAGDAFTATMIHTLIHGWEPVDAAIIAQGAAAITVEADASVAVDISVKSARARAGFPTEA